MLATLADRGTTTVADNESIDSSLAEAKAALAGSGVFGALDGQLFDSILARAKEERLAVGAILFRQGEVGDCAYLLLDGELEVMVELAFGKVRLAVLGPNQLVGEIAVFSSLPRSATVCALSPARLLRFDRADVLSLIKQNPEAGVAVIADLGQRLTTVNQPLAFLSLAAQALEQDLAESDILGALAAEAKHLGPFAKSFGKMLGEIEAKQVRRQEMEMAAHIQESMLPGPWDAQGPLAIHAFMRPTREVGGDLYDYFMIDESHLAFVVADVSGKGVPAALYMVMFRTAVKAVAVPGTRVEQVLARANDILVEDNDACMFVTVFFGVLDLASGQLSYVNAGHNAPYLLTVDGERLALPPNDVALGMVDQVSYQAETIDLLPGDRLFVFTDGITEAFSPSGEQFGEPRLEELLDASRDESVDNLVRVVIEAVDEFAGGREQSDDITCLALLYQP
jgi:serine phosphatase RsbU (regulator of sigma subunit)